MAGLIRVTEQAHPKTYNIDIAAPLGIADILRQCDLDIFEGWDGSQGLNDVPLIRDLESVAEVAAELLKRKQNGERVGVVLAGCGTSGRLAFMVARHFNEHLAKSKTPNCYDYLIAGDDIALLLSQELIEDDPHAGRQELEEFTKDKDHVLYIGITCGLSAAYVAGQLEYCMDNLQRYTPVLMGFNPVRLARDLPSEHWDKTFKQVAERLEKLVKEGKGFILNPIIGPEPITGSTRMKSASATKILLEVIFTKAHLTAFHPGDTCNISSLIQGYRLVHTAAYSNPEALAKLVTLGGNSLISGRHICYIASDSLGIVGMIDASECPPTCGSADDDVRGFVEGGFQFLKNREGCLPGKIRVSLSEFTEEILPTLSENDLIVVLTRGTKAVLETGLLEATKAVKVLVHFNTREFPGESAGVALPTWADHHVDISLPWSDLSSLLPHAALTLCEMAYTELACKWVCNLLSTGAHILHGKFVHNQMVDVQIRNEKLFHRAARIVQDTAKCDLEDAKTAVLKSIYQTDTLQDAQIQNPTSIHIQKASVGQQVVPVAILLATLGCSVSAAREVLSQHRVVRTAIQVSVEQKQS